MVHTLCYYGSTKHPSAQDWRLPARSMDCKVPSSVIIPAVAARLKYYLDVERKEAGFNVSVNQKDSPGNQRLYQSAARPIRRRPQENLLDSKLEASLRCYTGAGWRKQVEINPDHKRQVQRRIREKMSSFTFPGRFARNYVFLRDVNWKCSDRKVSSYGVDRSPRQAVSQGEFRRLISSAANLIVATTTEHHSQHLPRHRIGSTLKPGRRRSFTSVCVKEPSLSIETSTLNGDTYSDHIEDLGIQTVPATGEKTDYEIAVHTAVRVQEESRPSIVIRLHGESGRSNILYLQNPSVSAITSSAGRAFIFHVKTKDVGELTDLCIGTNKKDKVSMWYCKKVIVKKGTRKYVFPYNNWLSQCKTIKTQASGLDSAATRAQTAMDREPKSYKKEKDNGRSTLSKPQLSRYTNCMISKKSTFLEIHDGKLEISGKENKKSAKSPRRAEGHKSLKTRTAIRNFDSSEERRQIFPGSRKPSKVLVYTGRDKSDQITSMIDKSFTSLTLDVSKENNMVDVMSSSDSNLTTQPKKYRRASSPASYVFFALENKDPSVIVTGNGRSKRFTQCGSTSGKSRIVRRESSTCVSVESKCPGVDEGSSELALLQEILSDSGNDVTFGSLDSQPFGNKEEGTGQHEAGNNVKDVHGGFGNITVHDKLCSQTNCEAKMPSAYSCSCGEHSSYETDSTLDEEYFFSDASLDPSLSEDDVDSDSSSNSNVLCLRPEYNSEEHHVNVMKNSRYQIRRQRRVESCSENSSTFQRSLAAIHNGDDRTLRTLCLSHFFLPSVTDEDGKTLLHHAAAQDNPSACQVILDTNIGLVNKDQQDASGKTPLHYAILKGNPKTIKILLDNGAKAEIPDKQDMTVLDIGLGQVQAQ